MSVTRSIKRSARVNRNGPAVSRGPVTLTWSALRDRVARLAGGLSHIGVKPGDRVALLGFNSAAYLEAMFAVPWAGGIVVPLNTRLAPTELVEGALARSSLGRPRTQGELRWIHSRCGTSMTISPP